MHCLHTFACCGHANDALALYARAHHALAHHALAVVHVEQMEFLSNLLVQAILYCSLLPYSITDLVPTTCSCPVSCALWHDLCRQSHVTAVWLGLCRYLCGFWLLFGFHSWGKPAGDGCHQPWLAEVPVRRRRPPSRPRHGVQASTHCKPPVQASRHSLL